MRLILAGMILSLSYLGDTFALIFGLHRAVIRVS